MGSLPSSQLLPPRDSDLRTGLTSDVSPDGCNLLPDDVGGGSDDAAASECRTRAISSSEIEPATMHFNIE
jgi:hypothetical protein